MALTKQTIVDQTTVNELGIVFFREVTRITEDNAVIAEKFNRTSIFPGQSLVGVPEKVVAICNAVWTPEVIAAYEAHMAEALARVGTEQQPVEA